MTKVADSVYMVEGTGNETAVIVDGQPFPWHIAPDTGEFMGAYIARDNSR